MKDLPAAWNAKYEEYLGITPPSNAQGCLQDVHWASAAFGYFPSYTLGNLYAGCLHEAMRRALPTLDQDLAQGDTSAATGWLRENLQRHGALYEPRETVTRACGSEPGEGPLLDYLEAKFSAIYDL